MEREHPKRTRRNFTPEFKMEVLSYYYTHGEHRRTTYEKYGISEMNLRQWLKTYKIEKEGVSLQIDLIICGIIYNHIDETQREI